MVVGLLGTKLRMTQMFDDNGRVVPVTVVRAGPCQVVQIKSAQSRDGYDAVQLGYADVREKVLTRPVRGHLAKAKVRPKRFLREFPLRDGAGAEVGQTVDVSLFEVGAKVDIIGTSKGRGFTGTVKRYGFRAGPRTHGAMVGRRPGSSGSGTDPGRVLKGKRMAGRMGGKRRTVKNLEVVRVDAERNLLFVRGAVPGPTGGLLLVRDAKTAFKKPRGKKKYG